MNSLRQCHVRAGLAIPDRKSSGRPASARSNDASSGPGSEDPLSDELPSPLAWPRVYYLDVDYLAAAKAAQQCSAFFTSLLYVEHWCEQQFGELTLGAPDFSDEDQVPLHEQLLLNVYAKINEPDGIYGVARTHKAASQLRLYEHEGSWGKALGAYDDLLRGDVSGGGSGAEGGLQGEALGSLQADIFRQGGGERLGARRKEGSREQQALVLQKGLMRSLQQMGCLTVLDTYWQGLSAQKRGAVVDPELVELQYENAWRMGQWDLGSLAPGEAPGYNAMLHGAFKALGEGNREAFQGGLTSARQGLVRGIAHSSAESTQSVNPAIVRLQILEGMEEAWELKWPGSAQLSGEEAAAGMARPTDEQMEGLEEHWQERLKQVSRYCHIPGRVCCWKTSNIFSIRAWCHLSGQTAVGFSESESILADKDLSHACLSLDERFPSRLSGTSQFLNTLLAPFDLLSHFCTHRAPLRIHPTASVCPTWTVCACL